MKTNDKLLIWFIIFGFASGMLAAVIPSWTLAGISVVLFFLAWLANRDFQL